MPIELEDVDNPPQRTPCGCLLPHCTARTSQGTCLVFASKMAAAADLHIFPGALQEGATALMAALNLNERQCETLAVSLGLSKPAVHWSTLEGAEQIQALLKNVFFYFYAPRHNRRWGKF